METPNRVRELRRARGWTVERLARRAGLSGAEISRVERAERFGSPETRFRIADALGVEYTEAFPPVQERIFRGIGNRRAAADA